MDKIRKKLKEKNAIITVIGLGYIGLPLAMSFAQSGFKVNGIDIDTNKIDSLKNNKSYIGDINSSEIKKYVTNYDIKFTNDYNSINETDVIIICVPTPLNKTKDPDISYIVSVAKEISKYSIENKLICLESTVYPGATEEIILPILSNKNKLIVGEDFNLIFSPERMDPGQLKWTLKNTPKVIGGITENCSELGELLYHSISDKIIKVSSTRAAEMTKLLENTFRAANIGLINEMAMICKKLDLDIWEIIEAAKTKPYGYMPFYPGPGLGGHCIPVDPRYLEWKLETLNSESKYIKLSEEINFAMPLHVVNTAKNIIKTNNLKKEVKIIGITYKPNVSDTRESPAIDIMHLLDEEKIPYSFNDPYVKNIEINGTQYFSEPLEQSNYNETLGIIVTDHSEYNWNEISSKFRYIFDTRNALRNLKDNSLNIYKL